MRVLLIEDSPKLSEALSRGLREHGFSVEAAFKAEDGRRLAQDGTFDLIVLDLMLPDGDGVELCRTLRRLGVGTPILILTALSTAGDKVAGLNAGADDYLTKPCDFNELVARLRALLRRGNGGESSLLRFGDVELDLVRRRVTRHNQVIALTQKELMLLECFMRYPDRVLSRTTIGEHVWDLNFNPFSNVIDVYVSALRRKLDKPFDRPLIHTCVGQGYRFGLPDPDEPADSPAPEEVGANVSA